MNVVPMHTNPRLSAALAYASIGWHVMPAWWAVKNGASWKCACGTECKSPAKHPIASLAPWGQKSASVDPGTIKGWWERYPEANIAVFLEPSHLVGVDIDPRNGGLQTIEDIEAAHGPLVSDMTQYTGGGGEHRVFTRPANLTMPGKLGPGVDVKANGYLMMEPSNHISGGVYAWEASSDPRDGVMPSPLPDWIRDLAAPRLAGSLDEPVGQRPILISEDTKAELVQALQVIPADDRDTWLKVGMALQSTGEANWAFGLWDSWSQQSAKYSHVDQTRVWRSFKAKGLDGVTYKTIFQMAKDLGTVISPASLALVSEAVSIEEVVIKAAPVEYAVSDQLLCPPGIMRDVVDWINATSYKPQPQFAVQTAIAFAATVLGRRFATDHSNWPSLYLLNIGLSASGKEYAKTALERLLDSCGLPHLIGPSGYSSESALLSALLAKPNHVTVMDEFHRVLETASVKGNVRSQSTMKAIIECWARNDGTARASSYSTVGMSAKDAKALSERDVANPSLTLLCMAIPSFWETIGSAAAKDGFLNRILIVETSIGRQAGQFVPKTPVPQSIIDWATNIRARYTDIVDPDTSPLSINPVIVGISPAAMAEFTRFSNECIGLMDQHDQYGLAEMFGRSNEMAMKLALICALSRSASQVSIDDAKWAIGYVKTYAIRAVDRLKIHMADSVFQATRNQVLAWLTKHGRETGISRIVDHCRKMQPLNRKQQLDVMESLIFMGKVKTVASKSKTALYVAVEEEAQEE